MNSLVPLLFFPNSPNMWGFFFPELLTYYPCLRIYALPLIFYNDNLQNYFIKFSKKHENVFEIHQFYVEKFISLPLLYIETFSIL